MVGPVLRRRRIDAHAANGILGLLRSVGYDWVLAMVTRPVVHVIVIDQARIMFHGLPLDFRMLATVTASVAMTMMHEEVHQRAGEQQ